MNGGTRGNEGIDINGNFGANASDNIDTPDMDYGGPPTLPSNLQSLKQQWIS